MSQLPKGSFGQHHGYRVLYLDSTPENPNMKRKEYGVNSKKAKEYKDGVTEYLQLKDEYDRLLKQWNATYKEPPRRISFPLRKKRPDPIPYEAFEKMVPDQNPCKAKITFKVEGMNVKSKNEAVAVILVGEMSYRMLNEPNLNLKRWFDNHPDIVFEVPEIQKIIVIEVDGSMDDPAEANKAETRRKTYVNAGFREMKDVIFIRLTNTSTGVPLDVDYIRDMIIAAINLCIQDIIF